jgi:glycosyltransferase involved in cell wall biosynthesis
MGVAGRIRWAGWQDDPGPYFQISDLVVFPSRDAETLGNVLLEAWVWGKPLVTTLFRGARELARHGEDAWCVPCGDPAALAVGIQALLRDRRLAHELAHRGHARAIGEFGRDAILHQYLELYRSLAGG